MSGAAPGGGEREGGETTAALAAALVPLVSERIAAVRERIALAGGDPSSVRIVAVTKTFGPEAALAAIDAGVTDIGENYADELLDKAAVVRSVLAGAGRSESVRWHFVGAIQRNKVPRLAPVVGCWQSIAREVEAVAIARRTPGAPPPVFIEVNLSGDARRPGCDPAGTEALTGAVRATGLDLVGLMGVAPLEGGAGRAEEAFVALAALGRRLGLSELSMGMSGDLEAAVRAGTTMVRLGTALFGPRNRCADP